MKNMDEKAVEKKDAGKIPNQRELEKELGEYLSKKYGDRVKIISPFVIPKKDPESDDGSSRGSGVNSMDEFHMMPEEMETYLDGFVVKQDQVKSVLSTKVCTHFNRIRFNSHREATALALNGKKTRRGYDQKQCPFDWPHRSGKNLCHQTDCPETGRSLCEGGCHQIQRNRLCGR